MYAIRNTVELEFLLVNSLLCCYFTFISTLTINFFCSFKRISLFWKKVKYPSQKVVLSASHVNWICQKARSYCTWRHWPRDCWSEWILLVSNGLALSRQWRCKLCSTHLLNHIRCCMFCISFDSLESKLWRAGTCMLHWAHLCRCQKGCSGSFGCVGLLMY